MNDSTLLIDRNKPKNGDLCQAFGLAIAEQSDTKDVGPSDALTAWSTAEMGRLMEQIRLIAPQQSSVLLEGETGTGKTRLARLIHDLSPRRHEPFLAVNCGALAGSLIESEMFGHVRGAFTGADRDRVGKFAEVGCGTLLLDEIDALPMTLQSKLLRAVEERRFEPVGANTSVPMLARLIVASSRPLDREVVAGRFRADLYFRLKVVDFTLPPLRERRAAIRPLVAQFIAEFAARNGRATQAVTPEALRILEEYDWPGNIRELRNVVERAVSLGTGLELQVHDLPESLRAAKPANRLNSAVRTSAAAARVAETSLAQFKEEAEVARIIEALESHRDNRQRAARELGISRMTLYKKLHKYGLMTAVEPQDQSLEPSRKPARKAAQRTHGSLPQPNVPR